MKKIILDTNFTLVPAQFNIDIFEEIRITMNESYQLYVLDKTIDELSQIKKDKKQSLKNRNAAAALDTEKYTHFIKICKAFVKNPKESHFVETQIDIAKLLKDSLVIEVVAKSGKSDVVGSKLKKVYEFLLSKLIKNEFTVTSSGFDWNSKAYFWFKVKEKKLSLTKVIAGPPKDLQVHVIAFKRIYKKTLVKKGKLYAVVKRKFRTPDSVIGSYLTDPYALERVRSLKLL